MQWSNETYKGRKATYQFSKDGDFKLPPKPLLVMVNIPLSSLASSCPTPFSDYCPLDDFSKDYVLVITLTLLLLDESVKL